MSWYQDADNSRDSSYAPPKISQKTLDAGGNYVGAASQAAAGAGMGDTPLGNSGNLGG